MPSYWMQRKSLEYYAIVRQWLEDLGPQPSILDIGSHDTPVATWGTFSRRYTLDPRNRPSLIGVWNIVGRWPDARLLIPPPVSVITCLQVLEHLTEPEPFCREMFDAAEVAVILSVPWLWSAGATASHVQDPVDAEKLKSWTGRNPDRLIVSRDGMPRAVACYSTDTVRREP